MRAAWVLSVGTTAAKRARGRCAVAFVRAAPALALCVASACMSSAAKRDPQSTRERVPAPSVDGSAQRQPWRYDAPAGCPSQQRFLQELDARSSAGGISRALGAGPPLHVWIRELGAEGWRGDVWFGQAEGRVARDVTGADCDEVVVALALIASLWLPRASDPELRVPAATLPGEDAGHDVSSDAQSSAPLANTDAEGLVRAADAFPIDARASDADTAPVPAAAGTPPDTAVTSSMSPSPGSDARGFLVALLGYASEPAGAMRGGLRGELWGDDVASSWAAAAGLAYAVGQLDTERFGIATLRAVHAQLDLCPPGATLGAAWLRACVFGRGGGLHFSAPRANLDAARSLWRPWAALGPSLHGGLALGRTISLRAAAELAVNLVRDEFATEPSSGGSDSTRLGGSTLYDIAPLSLDLSLGVAYAF